MGGKKRKGWLVAMEAELRGSILLRRNKPCLHWSPECPSRERGPEGPEWEEAEGGEVEPERDSGAGPSGPRKGLDFLFRGNRKLQRAFCFLFKFVLRET